MTLTLIILFYACQPPKEEKKSWVILRKSRRDPGRSSFAEGFERIGVWWQDNSIKRHFQDLIRAVNKGQMNWRNDPHTWWIISAIISKVHPRNFRCLRQDSNPWPVRGQCSEFTNRAMKPLRCDQVNLLDSCVSVRGLMRDRNVAERWIEETIFIPAGQSQRWCTFERIVEIVQQIFFIE